MKYAVVTGSTKGIGKAIAEKLLNEGWFVFVNYAHDDESAKVFLKEHKEYECQYKIIKCELSSYKNAYDFINQVLGVEHTATIDCLVLNAAVTDRTPFDEITHENWEYVVNTNINVPFYLAHGFRNNLITNSGRIIFIGSICGIYPHAMSPAYGVTKAATHQMAKELVKFFAPKGITVNTIVPGFTATPWQNTKDPEQKKRIENKIARHRFAYPEEIANLCWEVINNNYINGANLQIDGGYCYY